MKHLTLIRHASASWIQGQSDQQRTLTAKGKLECVALAQQLKNRQWLPDQLKVSPAVRTQTTAAILYETLPEQISIVTVDTIYEAHFKILMNIVRQTADNLNHLCLVGHNPGLSELASDLTCQHPVNMSPGNAVQFRFETDQWDSITENAGQPTFFLTP